MTARVLRALFPAKSEEDITGSEEAELLPILESRGLTSEAIVAYTLLQPAAFLIKVRFPLSGRRVAPSGAMIPPEHLGRDRR